MPFEGYREIGVVARLYSYKGEVYIRLFVENPEEFLELESLFLNINEQLVPFFIEHIQKGSKGMLRLKLEDIESESDAKKLLKKEIFLPESKFPAPFEEKKSIIGYKVFDRNSGELGLVEDILDISNNRLISIIQGDKEILVPYQEAFIEAIEEESKVLRLNLPEGLIDLNE